MKKSIINLLTATVFLLISGSAKAQHIATAKQAIAKTNALYFELFSKKDPAIVNLYTGDACLFAPNAAPICGKAALMTDFKDTFKAGHIKGVKFVTINIYGESGNFLTEEGTWQVFDTSGKLLDNGKYLKLWKRAGGAWRIFRDVFNSDRKSN